MEEGDSDTMITHASMYPVGDDLTAPPVPLCWPVTTTAEAYTRLRFSHAKTTPALRA